MLTFRCYVKQNKFLDVQRHHNETTHIKSLTPKCDKYSNDYHRCKSEICTLSNIIKYDMQN